MPAAFVAQPPLHRKHFAVIYPRVDGLPLPRDILAKIAHVLNRLGKSATYKGI